MRPQSPVDKHYDRFWDVEAMYASLSKRKREIGNIISELNPKLRKTPVLHQML